jgi:hypothetical protein
MFRTTGAFGDAIVRLILSFAALAIFASTSAFAQPPNLAVEPLRYGLSPWWLGQPVIAVTGSVEMEVPANEASFEITFDAVQKTSQDSVREVAQKASALGRALQGSSNDRVQVQSKIAITPLYEQYRDKDGNRIDNGQPDKIERYQAAAIYPWRCKTLIWPKACLRQRWLRTQPPFRKSTSLIRKAKSSNLTSTSRLWRTLNAEPDWRWKSPARNSERFEWSMRPVERAAPTF